MVSIILFSSFDISSGHLFNYGGKDQLALGLAVKNLQNLRYDSWYKWNPDTLAFEDTGVTTEKKFGHGGTAMIPMNFFYNFMK